MKAFILIAAVIAFSSPVFAQTSANDTQIIKLPRIEVIAKRQPQIIKLPRIEVVAKRKPALMGQSLTSVKKINLITPYSA
ncbi:hypothetical protein R6242_19735 [Iodobacter sp. CM08]|uniref:hypothetical protein n=1 Tax=Iodobacter sp. CM08 TaxID=3085902 RepID=UPI002981F1A3|nr:hypothetical protein [Iodobacter sp. CM08]MDW5418804.1 hypothetical protein [Iodobacter sp. CM08]